MLVATLLIFAVTTTGNSTGDVSTYCGSRLSEFILELVCLSLGVLSLCIFVCLQCIIFAIYFSASYSGLSGFLSGGLGVSRGKRPNTHVMSVVPFFLPPRFTWEDGTLDRSC